MIGSVTEAWNHHESSGGRSVSAWECSGKKQSLTWNIVEIILEIIKE